MLNIILYREIGIALHSKRGLWVVQSRKLAHGETGLDMCADSTECDYIMRIRGGSQIVIAV